MYDIYLYLVKKLLLPKSYIQLISVFRLEIVVHDSNAWSFDPSTYVMELSWKESEKRFNFSRRSYFYNLHTDKDRLFFLKLCLCKRCH